MPTFHMKYKILSYLLLYFALVSGGHAQDTNDSVQTWQKVTLSGTIANESNNETLIGATLVIPEARISTMTNSYGFYSVTLPQGEYTVTISYMGFDNTEEKISLTQNTKKDFAMHENSKAIEEVVIKAN